MVVVQTRPFAFNACFSKRQLYFYGRIAANRLRETDNQSDDNLDKSIGPKTGSSPANNEQQLSSLFELAIFDWPHSNWPILPMACTKMIKETFCRLRRVSQIARERERQFGLNWIKFISNSNPGSDSLLILIFSRNNTINPVNVINCA